MQPYYDLGGFHYQVTTDSRQAQTWFDRGLAMCIGFNHEEAVRCFEKALAADPGMPMALWGIAYAWGPNINNMLIEPAQISKAEQTLHLAKLQAAGRPELERRLIDALATRYATPLPENRDPLNQAYAEAMRKIYQTHNNDPLVVSLYAESLMNLQPWRHWSPEGKPGVYTPENSKSVGSRSRALAQISLPLSLVYSCDGSFPNARNCTPAGQSAS